MLRFSNERLGRLNLPHLAGTKSVEGALNFDEYGIIVAYLS